MQQCSSAIAAMGRVRFAVGVSLCACILLQATPATARDEGAFPEAQAASSTTGVITGTITDGSGAVLPEVTVTISGAALMAPRTVVSGSEGLYRFPALPPGEYSLAFAREGFTKVNRDGIYVGLGFTATVDVELGLNTFRQDLSVIGGSTVVDKESAAVSANFSARLLSDLPTSRSMFAILSLTPAVHVARIEVGGSSGEAGGQYAAVRDARRKQTDGRGY
jgi:Carboxypeptidase regulatory-like domain